MPARAHVGVLLLSIAVLAAQARAEDQAAASDPAAGSLADPAAVTLEDATALAGLLPPGVRPSDSTSDWQPSAAAPPAEIAVDAAPLVERVAPAALAAGDRGWVEVEYTIDPSLDSAVREVLAQVGVERGQVILMEPASGDLLAYVSTDPVAFSSTRTYPMASLAKLVTAAAMLRRAPDAKERKCRYVGSPYALGPGELIEPRLGGTVDPFWRALAISNNQCFARIAVNDLGAEALRSELEGLGLLDAPAPGHPPGRFDRVSDALDLGRLGSGLAGSFISPLAAVRLAGVLARGELVRPRWIARARDAAGHSLALPEVDPPRRVWPLEIADELRALLVSVTTKGTAKRAFLASDGHPRLGALRVAGKTGTLHGNDPAGLYQWFIGVAPADEARVAIAAVVLDGAPGHGAALVAAEVLQRIFCDGDRCTTEGVDARIAARAAFEAGRAASAPPPTGTSGTPEPDEEIAASSSQLDAIPRPIGVHGLELPRQLLEEPVSGKIVLLLELSPEGEVKEVRVDSSDLPEFEAFVVATVRGWRFTPPTRQGRPVEAQARLPIPIRVR